MVGSIKIERSGARVVELFMPFELNGNRVEEVTLGPFILDHTLRWKEAKYKDWFELMVDGAVINGKPASSDDLRQLRYPDADRIVTNFIAELPPEIRDAVISRMWPTREPAQQDIPSGPPQYPPAEEMQSQIDPLNLDE